MRWHERAIQGLPLAPKRTCDRTGPEFRGKIGGMKVALESADDISAFGSHPFRKVANLKGKLKTVRILMRVSASRIVPAVLLSLLSMAPVQAADNPFHNAPESAKAQKNPLAGQQAAVDAGKALYARNCLACHGKAGKGTGNVPSLVDGKLEGVSEGEIFWFITKGDKENGMPSWAFLPEPSRWKVVSYVEALASGKVAAGPSSAPEPEVSGAKLKAASPNGPFTDFRYEK